MKHMWDKVYIPISDIKNDKIKSLKHNLRTTIQWKDTKSTLG